MLNFVGTVTIPAQTERFVARDHFIVDTSKKAKVRISYLGDYFKENFLDKVEEPSAESVLRYGRPLRMMSRKSIVTELGGAEKAETKLSEIVALMIMKANGEDGGLVTYEDFDDIFCVRNKSGVLCKVKVSWYATCWLVDAYPALDIYVCSEGDRVFARNFHS